MRSPHSKGGVRNNRCASAAADAVRRAARHRFVGAPPLNAPYPQVKSCLVPWLLYAPAPAYRPDPYDINHSDSKG
jgi:hypothetical protein